MTVYELDDYDTDDLIESIYFPDTWVPLTCGPDACFAVGDANFDGWIDNVNDQFSSDYLWPILYQDDGDVICYPTDPNVPCKRIDATVRIGYAAGGYSPPSCRSQDREICVNQGGNWDPNSCTCSCFQNGEWVPCQYF